MADVTIAAIEEMEPIYDGVVRRARATLGGPRGACAS